MATSWSISLIASQMQLASPLQPWNVTKALEQVVKQSPWDAGAVDTQVGRRVTRDDTGRSDEETDGEVEDEDGDIKLGNAVDELA